MSQSDYSTKMQAMFIDRDTYWPLTKDPTTSLDNKMNRIQMKLRQEEHLLEQTYHQLRSSAGMVPRLYGLPKIHKPDIPLRPIVSLLSSPTHGLSKFLASLLKPVVGLSPHHVRNSQHFAQFIRSHHLENVEVLVSYDVVSLFMHVPTDLALQVSRKRLESDPSLPHRTGLIVDEICSLLCAWKPHT